MAVDNLIVGVEETCELSLIGRGGNPFSKVEDDVLLGLTMEPKTIPSKYFYDDFGSALFEQITKLPEYYQTRTEASLLKKHAGVIVSQCLPMQLVELGSGSSTKTRMLLDAMAEAALLDSYVPVDISSTILKASSERLLTDYPGLDIHCLIGDFEHDLDHLPPSENRLIVVLGGTIGNFDLLPRRDFLTRIYSLMEPSDHLMIGVDLVKDRARLESAYNDSVGITEMFNKNILTVLNREIGSDFDLDLFEHVAFFDPDNAWIEMRLRALSAHSVQLGNLSRELEFDQGEEIRTEISCKFTRDSLTEDLLQSGLSISDWHQDERADFALCTAQRSF